METKKITYTLENDNTNTKHYIKFDVEDRCIVEGDAELFETAVSQRFDTWLENSNPAMEYGDMYWGDEAIYDASGSVFEASDGIMCEMIEEDQKIADLDDFDLAAYFQD